MTNMRANALYANLSSLYHLGGVYSGLHDFFLKNLFHGNLDFQKNYLESTEPHTLPVSPLCVPIINVFALTWYMYYSSGPGWMVLTFISQRPQSMLGFTLYSCMGLSKRVMLCIYHYSVIQNYNTPQTTCLPSLPSTSNHGSHWVLHCLYSFPFCPECHTVGILVQKHFRLASFAYILLFFV